MLPPLQPGEVLLSDSKKLAAARAVAPLVASVRAEIEAYSGQIHAGDDRGPTLHFDDVSDIPFLVDIVGVEQYQHRARLRARDGDLMASITAMPAGYEEYCHDTLDLGTVECLIPEPTRNLLAVADACRMGPTFDRLVGRAEQAGRLLIHPYMGIDAAWALARELASAASVPVEVIGPPPPVTWMVNDKARFEDLVRAVLDDDWLVESSRSDELPVIARGLLDLAGQNETVAIKRLRCASAMGNLVLDSKELLAGGMSRALETVEGFLHRTEWQGDEDVLMIAWETTDLSPSTQLWIPPEGHGEPRLDGVYDQILEGEEKMFIGSKPSVLPRSIQQRLGEAALALAHALQRLGYSGRCSFDHLVVGDPAGDPLLRFIECNGRWGGTSTPMSFLDRLIPPPRPWYRAQDFEHPGLLGVPFREVLDTMGDSLFRAGSDCDFSQPRFLFYNVGPLEKDGKLDVIAVASSSEAADEALEEQLPRILGL